MVMKIVIASDKAGFELKQKVARHFAEKGCEVIDAGLRDPNDYMSYFTASDNLAKKIMEGQAEHGILICGTGAGMCINANRYKGIFAVACESIFAAKMCRVVNDANVLTMGANIVGPGLAMDICNTFLNTGFTEGLSEDRADYLKQLKKDFMTFLEKK
jgi:ribose 5-phosphate isomerase B